MEPKTETAPQEKYKGTGKFTAFMGGASKTGIVTGGASIAYLATQRNALSTAIDAAQDAMSSLPENASRMDALKTFRPIAKYIGILAAAFIALPIIGGWISGHKAGKGKKQFEENQKELVGTRQQVAQLSEAVAVEREQTKRYTDIIASREGKGSHAGAVQHDKQHADTHHAIG